MNIKKVFTFALAGALSISMLAGCGSSSNESTTSESKEDTSLTDVQAAGHFTLGLDADFAPMGFTDDNGEIVGFDIDLAKAVGEKTVDMIHVKDILKITGYVRGGCSPLGMKKLYPTVFDASAENFDEIYVSGGRIGLTLKVNLESLLKVTNGKMADITMKD